MLVAERFIHELSTTYGKQSVSTDDGTWYPQACKFLKLEHHLHSKFEKSIIERTIQYIKDRTECFDDYFPCRKNKCRLIRTCDALAESVYRYAQWDDSSEKG